MLLLAHEGILPRLLSNCGNSCATWSLLSIPTADRWLTSDLTRWLRWSVERRRCGYHAIILLAHGLDMLWKGLRCGTVLFLWFHWGLNLLRQNRSDGNIFSLLRLLDHTLLNHGLTVRWSCNWEIFTLHLDNGSGLRLRNRLNWVRYCLSWCFLILFRVLILMLSCGVLRECRLWEPLSTLGVTTGLVICQMHRLWLLYLRNVYRLLKRHLLMQILVRYFSILRVISMSTELLRGHLWDLPRANLRGRLENLLGNRCLLSILILCLSLVGKGQGIRRIGVLKRRILLILLVWVHCWALINL